MAIQSLLSFSPSSLRRNARFPLSGWSLSKPIRLSTQRSNGMGIGVPRGYIKVVANGTRIYVQGNLYSHYGIIDIYLYK